MTNKIHKPVEGHGVLIKEGDWVMFAEAPASLLKDLPDEDQAAISLQAGKPMQIVGFDEYGYVEIEFTHINEGDHTIGCHTIWVEPKDLFKVDPPSSDNHQGQ